MRIPQTDFLKTAAGQIAAIRTIRQGVDQSQVGGLGGLFVQSRQTGVNQVADISASTGVKNVNLVAARGRDGGLVGTNRQGPDRVNQGRRQTDNDLGPFALAARSLRPLIDPKFDQSQLFRGERLFALGRHERFFRFAGSLDQQALRRLAPDDRWAALSAFHERFIVGHVQLGFLHRSAVAEHALVDQNRLRCPACSEPDPCD